ncbi:hypothetical protein P170DRAFT_476983 [Aspergillus steynii IBT 23096]|uniref:Zn(2)-C6 fungal-type domain-containing protein n=1 Tax=Aspergillus steynii IBT 23096 TaxID=1392250 RepID=A0A2I2G655_9EURO|nr:uncharacterized protein P170DRAFT_476983 [Aspergillus steynii IBT 23096]PLB48366.1 hypothetical protein P170DRAFT_476983 [Aspergillus steynii IBT 23096]
MADSGHSGQPTPKFKRCRTGCLRCRVRRRKCDEGKPNCQNCIDKNLVCQYGLQVSFLEKNIFTVSALELRTPKKDAGYEKIQFVKEDPLACATDASTDESPSPVLSPTTDFAVTQTDIQTTQQVNDGDTRNVNEQHDSDVDEDIIFHNHQHLPSSVDRLSDKHFQSGTAFSDRDESAVRGLLALGSSNNVSDMTTVTDTTPGLSDFDSSLILPPLMSTYTAGKEGRNHMDIPSNDAVQGHAAVMLDPEPAINYLSLPESERLELLRHYRYHVAPWLDICDMRQPFGLSGLQSAMGSEKLLSTLMQLSKACMIQSVPERGFLADFTEPLANTSACGDSTEDSLLYVLDEVRHLVSNIPMAWDRNRYLDTVHYLVQYAHDTDINAAMYWLALRFDLGAALANDRAIQLPLPMSPIPSISLISHSEDTYERIRYYAHSIIWITGKALIICHTEDMSNQLSVPHQLMDSWLQVFEELNQWYHLRPLEFQPMIEVEGDDQMFYPDGGFPLLLFANGAGAFSNQLYHTAMLLLLQSKPRTVMLHNSPSRFSSPLWHAQQICGVALNNDRRECWDPCLLASFLIAARLMTHESQQKEILQGFDRIKLLTGWDVGEKLMQLCEEWSFSEGGC